MKKLAVLGSALGAAVVTASPAAAQATGPDFSALTGAISFDSTSTAVLSIGAAAIGLTLAMLGVRKAMAVINRS